MRIKVNKTIVLDKLIGELQAAGIPALRVALFPNNGLEIKISDDLVPIHTDAIKTIIEAHDGIDDIVVAESEAKQRFKDIPNWATWTPQEAQDWLTARIDTLAIPADVKILLRAYGQMLLALRDKTFPGLDK